MMGAISSRFAVATHILSYLAWRGEKVTPSAEIARSVNTNPVVVRRIISALRESGLVEVQQGVDGGARLAMAPSETTLLAVYRAVEHAPLFSHHPQPPNAGCQVGSKIERALADVFVSAEEAMLSVLATVTIADVFKRLRESCSSLEKCGASSTLEPAPSHATCEQASRPE